jgi:hypothetical protein
MFSKGEREKRFEKERDKIYSEYMKSVNMNYSQMKKWAENPFSRKASLTRGPVKRNLRLLSKKKSEWNKRDVRNAKKTISFNSRMKKVRKGKPVSNDTKLSKRDISLRNWAYKPDKKIPL